MSEIINEQRKKAVELHQRIIVSAQLAQKNLWDMCTSLKQMRDDKLYKELGYSNFEDYCKNKVGMKRSNVYNYISIIEKVKIENVQPVGQIGVKKLALLATLSEEQQKEVAETVNLEDTTYKELKDEIDKLKGKNKELAKRLTDAEFHQQTTQNAYTHLEQINSNHYKNYCNEREKNRELEEKIKELENRPIEVAVADNPELATELKNAKATIKQLGLKLSEADQQRANEVMLAIRDTWKQANEEKEELIAEYEQKLEEQNSSISIDEAIFNMQKISIQNAQSILVRAINETKKLTFIYQNKIKDEFTILINGITDMLEDLK